MKTTVNAYAKINLYLAVTGKRANGYHDIESVMQSISLADKITVELADSNCGRSITLFCSDSTLPTDGRNLAHRAAMAYLDRVGKENASVKINIEKHIPVAAGLAGGSADAAGTLKALNLLYGSPLSTSELAELGATLGADIPFIIYGGTMTARGIGDILEPCPALPNVTILVIRPKASVSTAAAYAKIDELRLFSADGHTLDAMTEALASGSVTAVTKASYNVFEEVLPNDTEVFRLKKALFDSGASLAMMSGSGPTVFGLFENTDDALAAQRTIAALGYESELCVPINERLL